MQLCLGVVQSITFANSFQTVMIMADLSGFDPNSAGNPNYNIFGLPFSEEDADLIVFPVPWEVTVSYGSGASKGPEAILDASFQVDLNHQEFPELWKLGIFLDESPKGIKKNSKKFLMHRNWRSNFGKH